MLRSATSSRQASSLLGGGNCGRRCRRSARFRAGRDRQRSTAARNVVEIRGGMASAPAHDRHDGYAAVVAKEPGIKSLLAAIVSGCKSAKG